MPDPGTTPAASCRSPPCPGGPTLVDPAPSLSAPFGLDRAGPELIRLVQELLEVGDLGLLDEVIEASAAFGFQIEWGRGDPPAPRPPPPGR